MGHVLVALLSSVIATSAAALGTAEQRLASQPAPDLDVATSEPLVVIATSMPGESHAVPEECLGKNVICMRYPIWFRADPIRTVYGALPDTELMVTTYTHYGQPEPDDMLAPRAMLLLQSGGIHVMPTYASDRVWLHSNGDYYLFVESPSPPHWLPCSASSAREPVAANNFPETSLRTADHFAVTEYPHLYEIRDGLAFPRVGISMRRLAEHLRDQRLSVEDFQCDAEGSD